MDILWIEINDELLNGIKLLNDLPNIVFEEVFDLTLKCTESQEKKLQLAYKLGEDRNIDTESLSIRMKLIKILSKKMNKVIISPTILFENLTSKLFLNEEKAKIFVADYAEQVLKTCKEYGIKHFNDVGELVDSSHNVVMEVSSSLNKREMENIVQVDLKTINNEGKKVDQPLIEFDIDGISDFQQKLLQIQNEVDNMLKSRTS